MTRDDTAALARASSLIRDVPDFPKPGIVFKDIAPMLEDGPALGTVMSALANRLRALSPDILIGIESRGFLFAAPVAVELGIGMALVRKPGKLPWKTIREEYALEYGTDAIEMHVDAIKPGARVVVLDDVLATGGTAAAACALVRKAGGQVVACAFAVELGFLSGRDRLADTEVVSLFTY